MCGSATVVAILVGAQRTSVGARGYRIMRACGQLGGNKAVRLFWGDERRRLLSLSPPSISPKQQISHLTDNQSSRKKGGKKGFIAALRYIPEGIWFVHGALRYDRLHLRERKIGIPVHKGIYKPKYYWLLKVLSYNGFVPDISNLGQSWTILNP